MTEKDRILENTVRRCRERNIIIPTYAEMAFPDTIPAEFSNELKNIGLWDLHPRNLFRLTWKNEPKTFGGGFNSVNYLEFPEDLTGVAARIFLLLGKYFPTGSHKVGATFGPLVEKLVKGEFDPTCQKALWPSTGNYCRGGAYDSYLLACPAVAVLPEGMSAERFEWLRKMGAEIHATPGSESNVKEVYDKSFALKQEFPDEIVVLNQFEEFGNPIWHYVCTGPAIEEVFLKERTGNQQLAGLFLTQGSAGTLGSADYLRNNFSTLKVGAGEALQCPTILNNGYGEHRIEGIGDKHIPWILNVKNIDLAAGIDDSHCLRLMRLFNEEAGTDYLRTKKIPKGLIERLELLGISSIANLLGCIKMAKYYELGKNDIIFSVATDSMELYQSRLMGLRQAEKKYTELQAGIDFASCIEEQSVDFIQELTYPDKKRIHNLKYFTWVEQLGKNVTELDQQWTDETYWAKKYNSYKEWDLLIQEFNQKTGLRPHGESD